ncbi:phage anti-RecBCD protein [Shigella boydii]|uniref:phage anti-RecBCD protein n=1 Tax=Shigella boydii TaxID=621 RepID=UPI0035C84A7F
MCCSEVSISPLFRWPNSVCHFKNNFDAFLVLTPETKAERMYRRDIQLALKQEKDRTNETAMRPLRKATIDKFPEYIDPRLRNYRSRYGAISND